MLRPDDIGIHDPRGRIQRIHSGIDTQLGDGSRKNSGGVQVSKGGCGGWISQIVGWDKDGLHGRDGAFPCGGDSLLHGTHVGGEGWLVPHG